PGQGELPRVACEAGRLKRWAGLDEWLGHPFSSPGLSLGCGAGPGWLAAISQGMLRCRRVCVRAALRLR
ncbi:MAG TPA: hypothetical protein PK890_10960, partial [Terrimesophilobacter sp.]|nr:hypothetical protein [Terrimesophilobacter sp.]